MTSISLGFSPCPNDTFIFDAMIHQRIDTEGLQFDLVMEDVEALNQRAFRGELAVTKLSMGTWACYASPAVLSLILANTLQGMWVISAGVVYGTLGILMPLWERYYYRRINAVETDA